MSTRPVLSAFGFVPVLALAASAGAHAGAPQPGQCFGRTVRAPVVESRTERVQLGRGHWSSRRIAPVYATETHRTEVRPARTEQVRVAAQYRTSVRWVETPGADRWVRTEPQFRTEPERVLVSPAHAEWRPQPARFAYGEAEPGQTAVQPTGQVLCRVWCPATFAWREHRVMVAPGGWTRIPGAPHRKRIVQRTLLRPARTVERRVPAQYRVERTSHLVRPARSERVWVPARYGTVVTRHAMGGGEGWSEVVCAGPLSPAFRAQLQGALNARGYDAGPPDGGERMQTYQALHRFQHDHRMAEGQVTVESARALGIAP